MMTWSIRHSLACGIALILVVNAIALAGVAYNRSASESELILTQRELSLPSQWGHNEENTGTELTLHWRVPGAETDNSANYWYYDKYSGNPAWLDQAKLAALGFKLPDTTDDHRERAKEVLLVLELNGPDYQRALERAQQSVDRAVALTTANPGDKERQRRAEEAQKYLTREQNESSRLFAIDAGVDVETLRAHYADRSRYVIVRGMVRPQLSSERNSARKFVGHIESLTIQRINVPLVFKKMFERAPGNAAQREDSKQHFQAKVAFGKRLEPWLTAVQN